MMQIVVIFKLAESVDSYEIRGPPSDGELGTCFVVPLKSACFPVL